MGLGLVVGLNLPDGGNPNLSSMSASEVKAWGSALLSSSYPCALISWKYDSRYLDRADIRAALADLGAKARTHAARSSRVR